MLMVSNIVKQPTTMKKGVGISLVFIVLTLGLLELYLMLTLNESIVRNIKTLDQKCNSNVRLAIFTFFNGNQTENESPSIADLSEILPRSTKTSDSETQTTPELFSPLDTKAIEKSVASNYGERKLLPEVSSFDEFYKPIEPRIIYQPNFDEPKLFPAEHNDFEKAFQSVEAFEGPYFKADSKNEENLLEIKQKEIYDEDKQIEQSNIELLPPPVFKTEQLPSSEEYSYLNNDYSDGYPDYIY